MMKDSKLTPFQQRTLNATMDRMLLLRLFDCIHPDSLSVFVRLSRRRFASNTRPPNLQRTPVCDCLKASMSFT